MEYNQPYRVMLAGVVILVFLSIFIDYDILSSISLTYPTRMCARLSVSQFRLNSIAYMLS